jgi:DUF971 family protein
MTPRKLNLKRDEKLEILWADGAVSVYPLALLRRMCPCAACRRIRDEQARNKTRLRVIQGTPADQPLAVRSAEMVGNYALRLTWSDGHDSGIYSFTWLREIAPNG